jgi:hypothetical protein
MGWYFLNPLLVVGFTNSIALIDVTTYIHSATHAEMGGISL